MTRIEGLRLIAGFVLAPAIGVFALMLWGCAAAIIAPDIGAGACFESAFLLGIGGAAFAYPVTFIVGLPLFILFRIRGWLEAWQVALGGLLVGALFSLLDVADIALALMSWGVGLAAGLAFWMIAIFRNRGMRSNPRGESDALARLTRTR